jgi:cytosine/creatinine deaminase
MDLLVRDARLLEIQGLKDIVISDGKIQKISDSDNNRSPEMQIDAKGGLVLPTFIEPHVHLDKVLLGEELKEASSIGEARKAVKEAKKSFTVESIRKRAEKVLPWAIQSGVTIIRTHVDVDPVIGTKSAEAILELKKKFSDLLDIQVVAFPQEGFGSDSSGLALLEKALELGCDVVGGMPEAESSLEYSRRHIDSVITLARERCLPLDVHCDVLPSGHNIEYLATQSMNNGLAEKSTADHLIALSYYEDIYASKIISLIKDSSMNVVTNPCTMMTSGTSDKPPMGRGITRVKELIQAGVNVAFGSDNILDPYNPFGDFNPLSNGWLLCYGGQLSSSSEINYVISMPTICSARILGLDNYGIAAGCKADLNVFREKTVRELLRTCPKPLYVLKEGKIICENIFETRLSV